MNDRPLAPGMPAAPADRPPLVGDLRRLALAVLPRMYREDGTFVFRLERTPRGVEPHGRSVRYTAIAAIGLAGEADADVGVVLGGDSLDALCRGLLREVGGRGNLGDVALTLWAAAAAGLPDRDAARDRLVALGPEVGIHPTVEVAWSLAALCVDATEETRGLRDRLAARLVAGRGPAGVFVHVLGAGAGLRSHVSCFADMVYPIHALSLHHRGGGAGNGLEAALDAADVICRHQGRAGQWWWHYDARTGDVLEGYPVYSVHQDSMAPMALLALQEASGRDLSGPIHRGLAWLESSPELDGGSLFDPGAGTLWRKVARREPGKLSRSLQAAASRLHPGVRVPGLDALLPPGAIDHELRPYHLGWILYAFGPDPVQAHVG